MSLETKTYNLYVLLDLPEDTDILEISQFREKFNLPREGQLTFRRIAQRITIPDYWSDHYPLLFIGCDFEILKLKLNALSPGDLHEENGEVNLRIPVNHESLKRLLDYTLCYQAQPPDILESRSSATAVWVLAVVLLLIIALTSLLGTTPW